MEGCESWLLEVLVGMLYGSKWVVAKTPRKAAETGAASGGGGVTRGCTEEVRRRSHATFRKEDAEEVGAVEGCWLSLA